MGLIYSVGNWTLAWPYPRMHMSDYHTIGIAELDDWATVFGGVGGRPGVVVFEMSNDGTNWTAVPRFYMGQKSAVSQLSIATFGPSYVVSSFEEGNERVRTFFRGLNFNPTPTQEDNSFEANNYPPGISVCNFKGRCIVGGLHSTDAPWNGLGWSSVAWSAPGKLVFDPTENAGAGFAQLPLDDNGRGFIYSVRRLGDMVMAYGKFGVCGLKPYSTDRASGFGIVETSQPGISNGGMVGGDHHVHLYISDLGEAWLVSGKMEFRRLGYREFLLPFIVDHSIENPTIISYVPGRKRFYISNSSICYVLTEWGLYQCHQRTTGMNLYHNRLVGFISDSKDYSWRVKTGKHDFGLRALKTLESVEVGGIYRSLSEGTYLIDVNGDIVYDSEGLPIEVVSGGGGAGTSVREMKLITEYKYNFHDLTFTALPAKRVNPTGFVFPMATAVEFRVKVFGDEYRAATFRMDYLSMGVKLVDKRGIRRIYGNVSKGTSGSD